MSRKAHTVKLMRLENATDAEMLAKKAPAIWVSAAPPHRTHQSRFLVLPVQGVWVFQPVPRLPSHSACHLQGEGHSGTCDLGNSIILSQTEKIKPKVNMWEDWRKPSYPSKTAQVSNSTFKHLFS